MIKIAYDFIHDGEAERLHISNRQALQIFGVNPSSYASYCKRLADKKAKEEEEARKKEEQEKTDLDIKKKIRRIILYREGVVPGKRLLQWYMVLFFGLYLSLRKCSRYLRSMGLVARSLWTKPYKGQDTYYHQCAANKNYVMQDFYLGFRKVILTDITYLYYDLRRKVCYHCIFYDPFTDQVLGEYTSERMDVSLVKTAYARMMDKHKGEIQANGPVYCHSDNGSQYLETTFKELLQKDGLIQSFSRRATPGDNRPCEAENSRIKLALREKLLLCKNLKQVQEMVSFYHNHHNEKEVNMNLGGLTPNQYQDYLMTGVYSLEKYYGVPASDLHPIRALISRIQKKAEDRKEKSREEQRRHKEKLDTLKDILKGSPEAIIQGDKVTVVKEHIAAEKRKLAADADMKVWENLEKKVDTAVKFVLKADTATLEALKDRQKWRDYPELAYVWDFPSYAVGHGMIDKSKLSKNMSEVVDLWTTVEQWLDRMVTFITEADEETRKALEDKTNWKDYPDIAILLPRNESA